MPDRFRPASTRQILECRECAILFTSGRIEPGDYPDEYGPHDFEAQTEIHGPIHERYRLRLKAIRELAPPLNRRLLDVGCGTGAWLRQWSPRQKECVGVEIHRPTAEEACRRGLDVRPGTLEEQRFPVGRFDVITLSHVLEHVEDPRATLREAHRILVPGGQLIVWVPDFDSLLRPYLGKHWNPLDVPRHRWHFRRGPLTTLVRSCGFAPTEVVPDPGEYPMMNCLPMLRAAGRTMTAAIFGRVAVRMAFSGICALFRRADGLRLRARKV